MYKIDLNCDLGESFGNFKVGNDQEIMKYISSANIACGFHAGDPDVMNQTVERAIQEGVQLGAHPGFADLQGFGRRNMNVSASEAYHLVVYQVGALQAFAKIHGGKIKHVKPHGALYNMAATNESLANAIARAIKDVDDDLILYGLANSELTKAGERAGIKVAHEVFVDRTYQDDGTLTPRTQPNAMITSIEDSLAQVLMMIKEKKVKTVTGRIIDIQADTVCIHGDGENAVAIAKRMFEELKQGNIHIGSY